MIIRIFPIVLLVVFGACSRAPIENKNEALRLSSLEVPIVDDLGRDSLIKAVENNISFLKKKGADSSFQFGPVAIDAEDYIRALEFFNAVIRSSNDPSQAQKIIRDSFDFYAVYGRENWGEVFITSYYEPVIQGSRKPKGNLTQPLYKKPDDMVIVNVSEYAEQFRHLQPLAEYAGDRKTIWRGRLVKPRYEGGFASVVPYFSREEIDGNARLRNRDLEIAYVDPIDSFFIQIQGSGTVRFEDGEEMRVGYAAQNGHPYVAIGKYLTDHIPLEDMTLQTIERHLRSVSPAERDAILNKNPSYVFFKELNSRPVTSLGTEVEDGRTIATDRRYFPKGTLAFLQFEKPVFDKNNSDAIEPSDWKPTSRFVIDQDTGGAIRGGGRLDLFWGRGEEAERHAGVMKGQGILHYLVPKQKLIDALRQREIVHRNQLSINSAGRNAAKITDAR